MDAQALAAARAAWPGIDLPEEAFAEALPRCAGEHVSDFYLATACVHGIDAATKAFDRTFAPAVLEQARRQGGSEWSPEELRQRVWAKLLLPQGERPPKLAEYSGTGPLAAWLAVVVARTVVDLQRKASGRPPARAVEGLEVDLELDYLKRHYGAEFESALRAAADELTVRERNLLAHTIVDGLEQAEVAAIYGVHQSTASRWIAKARESLIRSTRRQLMQRLGVSQTEVDSILRLIHSRMDITLGPLLRHAKSS